MSLTPQKARFVAEYLIDLNAKDAAIRAGYSTRSAKQHGHALLQQPDVAAAIEAKIAARARRTDITQDWVVEKLRGVIDRCTEEETFSAAGAVAALALLAKHTGGFSDRVDANVDGTLRIEIVD